LAITAETSEYFSAQLFTQQWAQGTDANHDVYPVHSDVTDRRGNTLVTAYAVHRSDGQWSVLLVNKDWTMGHTVSVVFQDSTSHSFVTPTTMVIFGRDNYRWHLHGAKGFPNPDGPPVTTSVAGGANATFTLPRGSIMVLRGTVS